MKRTNEQLMARFHGICKEINVCPAEMLKQFPLNTEAKIKEWRSGEIDDVRLMREFYSLAKCNPDILLDGLAEDCDRAE